MSLCLILFNLFILDVLTSRNVCLVAERMRGNEINFFIFWVLMFRISLDAGKLLY